MKITDYFHSTSDNNKEEDQSVIKSQRMSQGVHIGTISTQTPKKRKERFTDPEVFALVDTIIENIGQLFGPKSSNAAAKAAIWDKVVERVNKKSEVSRTLPECKKRWQDYKRRVKSIVDDQKRQASQNDKICWDDVLSKRQMVIAQFFKWDSKDTTPTQLRNDSILNEDSEDDFIFSEKEETFTSDVSLLDSPIEVCVLHSSSDESNPPDHSKTKTSKSTRRSSADVSKPLEKKKAKTSKEIIEPTSTVLSPQQSPSWDSKLDQLIAQQQQTNEMLNTIRDSVAKSLTLQKRMSRMVKTNFIELHKSIMSNQKTSTEQSRALEYTLRNLHTEMNEISNHLRVKHLEKLMPDLDMDTLKPGKKRKTSEVPSPSGSSKKK